MKNYKLAILGDSATQLITKQLIVDGIKNNLDLNMYESNYDQIESEIRNPHSNLYKFTPDGVLIFFSVEKIQEYFYLTPAEARPTFSHKFASNLEILVGLLKERLPATKIFVTNVAEISDGVFGNNSNKYPESLLNNIRRINVSLMDLSQRESNLFILDIAVLQSINGRNALFDPRLFIQASLVLVGDGISVFSKELIGMINSSTGGAKKCLILDLDNTVWGGVIGDDGVEKIEVGSLGLGKAFTRLQKWAKELQLRGILLAVCSKNTEEVAKGPFESHPEMTLRLEDISIFVANWNDKASNIKFIQSNLNIGFDSMVFVDDNPFERELVRKALPQVCVPELPEDPADYVDYLAGLNLFEPGILSSLDAERTKMIQKEIERNKLKNEFSDESEFLKNIHMVGKIENFTSFNMPRVAQLSERSNQYNLRTLRYSESDVKAISLASDQVGMAISLKDDLGDHGLISVIVLRHSQDELFIENWFMSCRVLKRGVEYLALNKIVDYAKKFKCKCVTGEYIPTLKNALVKDHFQHLGFTYNADGRWSLSVDGYTSRDSYIKEE